MAKQRVIREGVQHPERDPLVQQRVAIIDAAEALGQSALYAHDGLDVLDERARVTMGFASASMRENVGIYPSPDAPETTASDQQEFEPSLVG